MTQRRSGGSRRSYLGAVPRKLSRPCPREGCLAWVGRPCVRTDAWGVKVALKDTHKERKPRRARKADGDES